MPKPGLWMAAWVGMAPLMAVLRRVSWREAALYGFAAGAAYFAVVLSWVALFGYLPWAALVALEAAFIAAFAVAAARMMPDRIGWFGYLAVPAAWTVMQWTRSLGTFSLTWGSLAHTQADNLPIAQLASITGPWGVDFLVCLVNLALAGLLIPEDGIRRLRPAVAAVGLVGAVWIWGWMAQSSSPAYHAGLKVAVVQGNMARSLHSPPEDTGRTFETYAALSRQAAMAKPDFIVWPETTLATDLSNPGWNAVLSDLARGTNANYVIGGYDAAPDPAVFESYNGAHFFSRDGAKLGVYHKVRLVPYGEFVPLRESMPFLKRYGVRTLDVLPGEGHLLIDTEFGKAGVSICFESLFPQIPRLETLSGAQMLFVITNDSWFEKTQAARHHLMMAKLRAIENRRFVVRAASTGISAIIDPYGKASDELGIFRQGIVTGAVTPLSDLTPYTRFGDYFAYLCLALAAAGLVASRLTCSPSTSRSARRLRTVRTW